MAKIKINNAEEASDFANEVQEALAELTKALNELKEEVKAIKDAGNKNKKKEDSFWN